MFKFEDFTFIKAIGTGTFGRVYLVTLKKHPTRHYARKILRIQTIVALRQVNHTRNEKQILAIMRPCPFVVKYIASFKTTHHICLLLEYIPGGELFTWLKRMGRFDVPTIRFYSSQILLMLEMLHANYIVFRDLKPENVLIGRDGYLKITDLGFSKIISELTYTICGTPEYMAPEELEGMGHGREVDYWSLGVIMYEMAIGVPPFYDRVPFKIYEKILGEDPKYPKSLDPVLVDLIVRLLEKDKNRRIGRYEGVKKIMEHAFFKDWDWESVRTKSMDPPIYPMVLHGGDTSNFCDYDENENDESSEPEETFYRFFD